MTVRRASYIFLPGTRNAHLEDFAEITGNELVRIEKQTHLGRLRQELAWSEAAYKLR